MKKTIVTCCLLASAVVFSSSLYANKQKCVPFYVLGLLERSKWQENKLVDSEQRYSYTVIDLATGQPLSSSSPESKELKKVAQVQSTKFDPTEKACTIHLLTTTGNKLSLKLVHQKLAGAR